MADSSDSSVDWEATFAAHCLIALSKSRSSPPTKGTATSSPSDHDKCYLSKVDNNNSHLMNSSNCSKLTVHNVSHCIQHVPPSPSDRLFRPNVSFNFGSCYSSLYGSNASSPVDSRDDGGHSSPSISSLDSLPLTISLSKRYDLGVSTAGPFFTTTTPSSPSSSSSCFSPVMLDQPVDLTRSSNGEFH